VAVASPKPNLGSGNAYVGDAACSRCHPDIAETFARHPMGRSMADAAEVMPEVEGIVFEVGNLVYSIERRDGRVFHREAKRDEAGRTITATEAEVRYALGSGTRGFAFLVERDGGLFQSPIAWYSEARRWDLAPTYHAKNLHFDRPITLDCLFCHTNRVEWAEGRPPVFLGLTIGCERCHGPGQRHASGERTGGEEPTIVNPADLEPVALREAVCEQCHWLGFERRALPGVSPFDYRPGLPLQSFLQIVPEAVAAQGQPFRAVGHVEQLRQSRCHQGSGGWLGCVSCHDPHHRPDPEQRATYYRDRCLRCHEDGHCSLSAAERRARGGNDCAGCHMPKLPTSDIAHTSQTLHTIIRPTAGVPPAPPLEEESPPRSSVR
jgi:hypothetical protein